ncbi:MAG: hypothetical protein Q7U54_04390, partial [Bacteroidales bacterium]|nr:hypothetical protein [Bacteroidales bacterium]
ALLVLAINKLTAQAPPHPNGGAAPSGINTPVGAGAPVGSGTLLLLGLAGLYSGKKVYNFKKR